MIDGRMSCVASIDPRQGQRSGRSDRRARRSGKAMKAPPDLLSTFESQGRIREWKPEIVGRTPRDLLKSELFIEAHGLLILGVNF